MTVKKIVTNIAADDLSKARQFYEDILDMELVMDLGWITTYSSGQTNSCLLSVASEGGSGTPVPDMSIEVDNLTEVYERVQAAGLNITYPMTTEPWGIKRFYVIDPFGKTINLTEHVN